LEKARNIEILVDTNILEITGKNTVEGMKISNPQIKEKEIGISGVFIEVGSDPRIKLAKNIGIETDEEGYIKIGKDGTTSVEGVWAAGDATNGSDKFRQIITAASEGAIAARSAANYLKKKAK
jgi:thioredoxin reductase